MNPKIIAKGAATLVVKRLAGPFWIRRRWLNRTQWLSYSELQRIQLRLLTRLIRHSYSSVPFYRRMMNDRQISVGSITTLEDIKRFPIIDRKDVLHAGDSIISGKYPAWLTGKAYTGGTTGTPLQLRRDLFSIANEHAFVRRQWDWAGIGLRDKCVYLTGRLIAEPDQKDGRLYTYDPIMKELILSTYHLSPNTAKDYIRVIKDYNPKAIVGYPSAVYLLARTCLDLGSRIRFKSALTSSEVLTESMKNTIVEAFECKVFDFYGSAERICYIHTCEYGSYHIIPEYGLTELVPIDNADADNCRIISTGFWNLAMPFIRYDMGDIAVKSSQKCQCGRIFPVIESVEGRQADMIETPSGRKLGAALLTHLLYGAGHIIESQLIQDAADHLTIEFVPGKEFSEADLSAFRRLVRKHLPTELKFELKEVEAVRRTSSGKVRPVVSQLEDSAR